ncbi:hypothetical protein [Alcaligenes faecalis]|uniref:ESPR domain-containing protein n=1 Tax=Alcaligenes faecalis TaxID=511 RepID=A0ABY7N657_ALCFA|nr:hypothetical protein [Alcaligenes faecalis]WBM38686.1 hypothetical protein M2J83_02285 [Alcaligenes faecalis]
MMAADSLQVAVHRIVPSGMFMRCMDVCRCACSAGADPMAQALHLAQPPTVQASCLESAEPTALAAVVVVLAACRAATPHRRCRARQREAKAEGKTKGSGTCPLVKPVCTWESAARDGIAAVPLGARASRQYWLARVLRTTGYAVTTVAAFCGVGHE